MFDDISGIIKNAWSKFKEVTGRDITLEEFRQTCDFYSFPQTWASTTLGFDGWGGQGFTKAQTTVIMRTLLLSDNNMISIVYFGGRYAYTVMSYTNAFRNDLQNFKLASVRDASKYGEILR